MEVSCKTLEILGLYGVVWCRSCGVLIAETPQNHDMSMSMGDALPEHRKLRSIRQPQRPAVVIVKAYGAGA